MTTWHKGSFAEKVLTHFYIKDEVAFNLLVSGWYPIPRMRGVRFSFPSIWHPAKKCFHLLHQKPQLLLHFLGILNAKLVRPNPVLALNLRYNAVTPFQGVRNPPCEGRFLKQKRLYWVLQILSETTTAEENFSCLNLKSRIQ